MNQPGIPWLLPSLLIFCCADPGFAQEVSLRSLLREMTSRETLARCPSPQTPYAQRGHNLYQPGSLCG